MSYVALRFDAEAADGDAWSDALLDAGALVRRRRRSARGHAGRDAVFDEPGAADPQWWPVSRLTALFAPAADPARGLARRCAPLWSARCRRTRRSRSPTRTGCARRRRSSQPIRIADDLWIVPSWCAAPRSRCDQPALDPGSRSAPAPSDDAPVPARGSREHVGRDTSVLDYGCGSGILAIAAAKLGAPRSSAPTSTSQAVGPARDNARANGVDATFVRVDDAARRSASTSSSPTSSPIRCGCSRRRSPRERAPGGRIALAGILAPQADDVSRPTRAGSTSRHGATRKAGCCWRASAAPAADSTRRT